jgi:3-hydroxyisobutyrate dehydrogenase-like beta-hydroxyacid dehydrogenase
MPPQPIAFFGLGLMGRPMAEHLIAGGHTVTLWNRTRSKADGLGAPVADRPAEAVREGGLVFSLLADDRAVLDLFGDGAIAARLGPGGVHVGLSTVAPETARRLAEIHAAAGSRYMSAPVMGRPEAVAARKEHFLAAGPAEAKDRARPILEALGEGGVYDFGEAPESANAAKLINNYLIAATINALADAVTMAEKSGIDPEALYAQATGTLFDCLAWKTYGRQIVDRSYDTPSFKLSLGLKDVKLVGGLADATEMPSPVVSALHDRYLAAVAQGMGGLDWSGIARLVRRNAGLGD